MHLVIINTCATDKAQPEEKEAAHTKFQEVAFAYAILSDERRRKRFDTTGRTEESLDLDDDDFDWVAFYKEQYADVITGEAITKFADEYKGSDEERQAVLDAYDKHKGNMGKIYQDVMLSDAAEDDDRFRGIIDEAIKSGDVEAHKRYTGESEKSRKSRVEQARKRIAKETGEAEAYAKKIGVHDKLFGSSSKPSNNGSNDASADGDLAALIQKRQSNRGQDFLANLEAKYAPKGKKGKKRGSMEVDEEEGPPEEAFAATAARKGGKKAKAENGDATKGARRSKRARN